MKATRQNGACSLVSDGSTAASEPDDGACGSGSPRSSLHNIGANRPRGDLRGLGPLPCAVRLLVGRADEAVFDEDMSAFLDVIQNGIGPPRAKNRDAMPLDFRDPFVFCVFLGALRGDGKNGEF